MTEKQEYVRKELENIRTICCGGLHEHTSNCKWTCSICGKDVSLDYILITDLLEEEFDNLNEIKKYEKEV